MALALQPLQSRCSVAPASQVSVSHAEKQTMSVFDTLAERRYEEWLKKISADDYLPPVAKQDTAIRKSYEGYIFSEVVSHMEEAVQASTTAKREELLEKARQLEFQLVLLLEKRQMPLVAATLQSSLLTHRKRVLGGERE